MLILARKRNEQIVIGDDIVVTVVAIRGGNVRLGIEAPPNVTVHRKEVYEAIRKGLKGKSAEQPPTQSTNPPESTVSPGED
ncbi:MAG TPA: carbon storage regulator CsrA [Planctomycetaceae bacterium]|nr:carbon storage regulator CsrA [Planctomycetaceae bacterium]HIQ21801.1 carbon storage regulator [Planctomycetota bacterium]